MLTATNSDGPTFNTRSKTSHQHQTTMETETSNTQLIKDTVTQDLNTVENMQNITPKSLTADRHKALLQMQKMDPFCKCIFKCLLNGKTPKHEIHMHKRIIIQTHHGLKSEIYGTHHTQSLKVYITSRST